MQTVATGWTAEERDTTRNIVASTQVSWKKTFTSSIRFFAIGVSTIGGTDIIPTPDSSPSAWNKYRYTDESSYLTQLSYERGLNQPTGGVSKAIADFEFDNTSGRFTPRFMGGSNTETYTAVQKPRRPVTINAGFSYNGVDQMLPQFVGLTSKVPEVNGRNKTARFKADDFVGYLENNYVDDSSMFTGLRTDQVLENILTGLGYGTSQYELDYGIQIIPFGLFEVGTRWIDIVNQLVQSENGYLYQDELGKIRFENRQHWDGSPHNTIQRVIATSQVLDTKMPTESHLINVVEVKSKPRAKQPSQLVFTLASYKEIAANSTIEIFVNFDDPMLAIDAPVYVANLLSDGSSTDMTSSVSLKSQDKFAKACKIVLQNNSTSIVYVTAMTMYGRPAKVSTDIYTRLQDDSSVTAYEQRPFKIENDYIQSQSWANSYAQMILNDYSNVENVQEITIRALPELQLGDLVSWQGRYWRVFNIKSSVSPSSGFVQTIKLLQRTVTTYFRIGISTIGGSDKIAP